MMNQLKQAFSFATRPPRRQRGRFTGVGAVAAVVLLTLGAALIFSHFPSHQKPSADVKPTATATANPAPTKTWSPVTQLTFTGNPTMATSDSQVIYEVVRENRTSLKRTTNGGTSWQAVPLPFQVVSGIPLNATLVSSTVTPRNSRTSSPRLDADHTALSGYPHILQFLVSPLDPQVVWLQTNYRALLPPNCLAQVPGLTATLRSRAHAINTLTAPLPDTALSGTVPPPCIVQFFSTDGGQHWTQTASTTVFTLGHVDPPSIWVQGQRLYAKAYVNALSSPATATYLMTSMDGGTTWTSASDGIGDPICDARPAPTGSTVFAVTGAANDCFSSATIWRSDDTGKHWTVVSRLDLAEEQIYVAVGSGQPAPVIYLFGATTGAFGTPTTTLMVSLDGGSNWNPAPTPPNQSNLLGALQGYTALTSDGRLIAVFSFDETANHGTLYSWRVGNPQWSPIGPAPQTDATSWAVFFLAIPSLAGGPDALWYATNPSDLTMEFYRLQL